jgi:uncharacterized cupredoxin-like copper-binding protein
MNRTAVSGALAAVLLSAVLGACGSGGDEGSGGETGSAGQTIEISETEFKLDPASVMVKEPGTYTFHVVNDGSTVHALEIEGHGVEEETEDIEPGDSADLTVEINEEGEYELYCPIDEHREKGMEGTLSLGAGTGGGGQTTTEEETTTENGGGYGYR